MSTIELKASNIKCGGCASAIQEGLGSLPGVTGVEVDIETGTVRIEGENPDREAITAKLAELGYPVAA